MNLHEYQGKQLFAEYGLPVSKGIAAETAQLLPIPLAETSGLLKPRSTLEAEVKLAV
jgi:succinyl-CoA synthetase beta subunit